MLCCILYFLLFKDEDGTNVCLPTGSSVLDWDIGKGKLWSPRVS